MTSGGHTPTSPIFQSVSFARKMAATSEMEALREENERLTAENARLKATRAAIYKLYIESEGVSPGNIFTRAKVFEALQHSADREEEAPQKHAAQKPTVQCLPLRALVGE